MSHDDALLPPLRKLAKSLQALHRRAVLEYTPIVEDILRSRSRDTDHIEHTLDGLVGFCCYEPAIVLFKKLCRHYWDIDPVATAAHIYTYREMWDSEVEIVYAPRNQSHNARKAGDA